jgi:Relaxase/Mobilisation nuclease domain.
MFALHTNKGKSIAKTITDRTDYAANPDKTRKGELVTGYECSPQTVDAEFLLAKQQYFDRTGRDQGDRNVLAYHIRQAFKPGEITPELANELGRELAMRFTKGNHSFIVATHIDKQHIHNHVVFNSTNLECAGKFRDFKQSGRAIRRISDQICLEYGLSVIDNPKPSRGHYGTWLGSKKEPTLRERLKQTINTVLAQKPVDLDSFLISMETSGYEVTHGKHISFKGKNGKGFIRLSSLNGDYNEESIRKIIEGERVYKPKEKPVPQQPVNSLLIQIQRCVVPKGSPGYDRWAAVFNLKQLARTFNFLQDNNLLEYEKLIEKAQQAKDDFNVISSRIKAIDSRLPEISSLQKHIGTYSKTKDIYAGYRKSKWSKKYYSEHKEDIELHKAVKKAFDDLGLKKLPTIKALQTEYAMLLSEKKSLYSKYKDARNYMQEILAVKQNSEQLLGYAETVKPKESERI